MKMNFTKVSHLILAVLLCAASAHAQKYEAEDGVLTNGAKKIDCASCSEGAAVDMGEGNIAINVNIQASGFYNIYLHASSPGGEKTNIIRIDRKSVVEGKSVD